MSNFQKWSFRKLPKGFRKSYGTSRVREIAELVEAKLIEWRISGSTHMHLRLVGSDEKPVVVTLGASASAPAYDGKLRTLIRRAVRE